MSGWYYSLHNIQHGPISRDDLVSLLSSGTIGKQTLVWNSSIGGDWKEYHEILDSEASKVVSSVFQIESPRKSITFLDSRITADLIGNKAPYYIRKWRSLATKHNNDVSLATSKIYLFYWKTLSWNWAAFFLGPYWLLYRKMWKLASIFIITQIAAGILSGYVDNLSYSLLLLQLYFGGFGNAHYLGLIHKEWLAISGISNESDARIVAASRGGTSLFAALCAAIIPIVIATFVFIVVFVKSNANR